VDLRDFTSGKDEGSTCFDARLDASSSSGDAALCFGFLNRAKKPGFFSLQTAAVRTNDCQTEHYIDKAGWVSGQGRIQVMRGLEPTLFGGSLGGPISEVASQEVRDRTQAFTKTYVFRREGFGGRPCKVR